MKNIIMRILLAVLGIPFLLFLIFFVPQYNQIGMSLIFIVIAMISTYEFVRMIREAGIKISLTLSIINAAIIPTLFWLTNNDTLPSILNISTDIRDAIFTLLVTISLATEIINVNEKEWKSAINTLGANMLVILYPIFLTTYMIRLGSLSYSSHILFTFFTLVFINDTFAYTVGMLFGKKSWKPFPVSPNKSIVGYIGGIFFTIVASVVIYYIKPEVYNSTIRNALYLGIIIAFAANVGDLVESSIKRACGVKDSGKLMLGRGGILDTFDSLIFTAPILYYFFNIFIQNY